MHKHILKCGLYYVYYIIVIFRISAVCQRKKDATGYKTNGCYHVSLLRARNGNALLLACSILSFGRECAERAKNAHHKNVATFPMMK